MPYLIKSSEGKRSCSLIGVKKEENSIRSEIVEALRGLSFKIEIKINDVIQHDGQQDSDPSRPAQVGQVLDQPTALTATALSSGSLSGREEIPSVKIGRENPASEVLLPTSSEQIKTIAHEQQEKPMATPVVEQPKKKTPLNFAPLQAFRKQIEMSTLENQTTNGLADSIDVSTVYSRPRKPDPPAVITASAPSPVVVSPELQASREMSVKSEKIDKAKMMEIKAKIDQEQPTLSMLKFNRGQFKVGSTVETIYLADDISIESAVFVSCDNDQVIKIAEILATIPDELDEAPLLTEVKVGDLVVAKSVEAGDDSWSRALILDILDASKVEIYFLDWGVTEILNITRLRALKHPGLSNDLVPALAVRVHIENMPLAVKEGNEFLLKVYSYDDIEDMYKCRFISFKNS